MGRRIHEPELVRGVLGKANGCKDYLSSSTITLRKKPGLELLHDPHNGSLTMICKQL